MKHVKLFEEFINESFNILNESFLSDSEMSKFSDWWDNQKIGVRTKILNAVLSSADVRKYRLARMSVNGLSMAGWGVDYLPRIAKDLGLYESF